MGASLQPEVGHLDRARIPHPEDVVAASHSVSMSMRHSLSRLSLENIPNHHQTKSPSLLTIDELDGILQQNIHVGVNALQDTLVLGLSPLQADDDLVSNSVSKCQSPLQKLWPSRVTSAMRAAEFRGGWMGGGRSRTGPAGRDGG